MHLAMRVLGIKPGDNVMASTLTFIGSVSLAIYLGAKPVFIDSDPSSWNMDPVLLEKELDKCKQKQKLPKAVIPTESIWRAGRIRPNSKDLQILQCPGCTGFG